MATWLERGGIAGLVVILAGASLWSPQKVPKADPSGDFARRYHDPTADPKPGMRVLSSAQTKSFLRKPGKPLVLVALGDCTACTLRHFDPQDLAKYPPNTVLAFASSEDRTNQDRAAVVRRFAGRVVFLRGSVYQRLNVSWVGRAYLADRFGNLTASQPSEQAVDHFLEAHRAN